MAANKDDARGSPRKRSTTSKETDAARHGGEGRYRALLEAVPDMMFRVGADGTYLDFIPAKGLEPYVPPEEFLGKRAGEVLPQDVAKVVLNAIETALETGETQTIEFELVRQDETITAFEARVVPIGEDEVLVVARDVTSARQAEEELERGRALMQAVADSMATAVFLQQNDRLVYTNRAAADISGYSQDELLGMNFLTIVHDDDKKLMTARRDAYLAGKKDPVRYEFRLVRKDGKERWLDCSIGAPIELEGAPAIVGTAIDITERKRSEEALREARDELERRIEEQIQPASSYGLTFRELMVLSLASSGKRDMAIAAVLGISHRTVEAHMGNLLRKMKAGSRTEACVRAQRERESSTENPEGLRGDRAHTVANLLRVSPN